MVRSSPGKEANTMVAVLFTALIEGLFIYAAAKSSSSAKTR
jgi:hypothetical protein